MCLSSVAIAMLCAVAPVSAQTVPAALPAPQAAAPAPCPNAGEFARLDRPLSRLTQRVAGGLPVKVVAIGSSSTAGAGASSVDANYPSRLAFELKRRLRTEHVTVVNRGVNGEEAADMMDRFKTEIYPERPDLVIWQVGTNSLLRDQFSPATESLIHHGILQLQATNADILVMDAQYAPKVLAKAHAQNSVDRIAEIATAANIQVFQRFALMRRWHDVNKVPFDAFVTSDGLHMNDWGYACVAQALGTAISDAATRPVATATARPSTR